MNLRSISYKKRRGYVNDILDKRIIGSKDMFSVSDDGKHVFLDGQDKPFRVILTTHSDYRVAMTTITIGDVSENKHSGFIVADMHEKKDEVNNWNIFVLSVDDMRMYTKLYLNDASYHIVDPYTTLENSLLIKEDCNISTESFLEALKSCI